jgi:hypothetical protein
VSRGPPGADRLIAAAIELDVQDTTALSVFRQTWGLQDILNAHALVENVAARALLGMKRGNPLAAVSRSLECLAQLEAVETGWWRLCVAPPQCDSQPTFDYFGHPTPEHSQRVDAFMKALSERKADLVRRRDDLREEMRKLGEPLMALAARAEVNLQPARLRNLFHEWSPHVPSNPDLVRDARNFLADLQLKLQDPATAAALARGESPPTYGRPQAVRAAAPAASRQTQGTDGPRWVEGDIYALLPDVRRIRQTIGGKTVECDLSPLYFRICTFFHRRESATSTSSFFIALSPSAGFGPAVPADLPVRGHMKG